MDLCFVWSSAKRWVYFLRSYMKATAVLSRRSFFFSLPRHACSLAKRVLPHKVTSAVSCAFFFGRGAAALLGKVVKRAACDPPI